MVLYISGFVDDVIVQSQRRCYEYVWSSLPGDGIGGKVCCVRLPCYGAVTMETTIEI